MPIVVSPSALPSSSGTAVFTLDLGELIEEAFERCGQELRGGYDYRTARRSLNLLFADWANRGVNLWTLDSGTIALVASTATYTLPADTVDLLDTVVRINNGVVATQERPGAVAHQQLDVRNHPQQAQYGQAHPDGCDPRRRGADGHFVPRADGSATYSLVYWRMRRIQDAGPAADVTSDIPFRMLPPLASGLAYYLAFKLPGAGERIPVLKEVYDEDWTRAADEDREKAPFRIIPYVGRL